MLGQLNIVVERHTGILALIIRGRISDREAESLLPSVLQTLELVRVRGPRARMLIVANSDAQSSIEIASRLARLGSSEDRIALVAPLPSVANQLADLTNRMPLKTFRSAADAVTWLRFEQ